MLLPGTTPATRDLRFGFADGVTTFDYEGIEVAARDSEELGAEFLTYGESLTAAGDPYPALSVAGVPATQDPR